MSAFIFGCLGLVRQHPMKSHLSIFPFVCLSILKIGSIAFSDIVPYDSWSWNLVTDRARFLRSKFGPNRTKSVTNEVFHHFLGFGSLVFLKIAYSDSLQQCVTSSRGKPVKIFFGGAKFGLNKPKLGLKLVFWYFSKDGSLAFF